MPLIMHVRFTLMPRLQGKEWETALARGPS